jgi:KUP system potassium uptake protein
MDPIGPVRTPVVAVAEIGAAAPGSRIAERTTPLLALTALGIVYGDLGTSPLYTMSAVARAVDGTFTPETALGMLSLIVWALIITISIKYCLFVMRADNHGEGGILALMSLVARSRPEHAQRGALIAMGLFGAALIYGDGIITPAISVLSALEGLKAADPALAPYVLPAALGVLIALFGVQHRGTGRIGQVFGPIMLLWFAVIALLGLVAVARQPVVLSAIDPRHAARLLAHGRWSDFAVLGAVFLAITGGEALYADIGHVGRNPIRTAWYLIVLPALLLNYAGQTALLFEQPALADNPFFMLAPGWARAPLVLLATVATVIASQAIITGAFSLTRQAIQLGWFPGVHIRQTSAELYGEIYVPFVNWWMMVATLALTVGFGSSDRLAGAYGTAVSTTMLLTTALLYYAMRECWRWSAAAALSTAGAFLLVDGGFFAANLLKIADGGWIPLAFGAVVFVVMTTWHAGIEAVRRQAVSQTEPPARFVARIAERAIPRVPGTAVFLTRTSEDVPPLMVLYAVRIGALHATLIALTIRFEQVPRIARADRLHIRHLADGLWRITVRYGFVEVPDLGAALRDAQAYGCPVDLAGAIYFAARDSVVRAGAQPHLARWRLPLFAFMLRNAVHAVDLFRLPPERFLEIGRQIEI